MFKMHQMVACAFHFTITVGAGNADLQKHRLRGVNCDLLFRLL